MAASKKSGAGKAKAGKSGGAKKRELRSKLWFDNPENPGMTALYVERYQNQGYTREELQSGRPMIGLAQTGPDLSALHLTLKTGLADVVRVPGPELGELVLRSGQRPLPVQFNPPLHVLLDRRVAKPA